jgi:hypothetical protein
MFVCVHDGSAGHKEDFRSSEEDHCCCGQVLGEGNLWSTVNRGARVDEILETICMSKEIEEGIRQEDFYYLLSNGMSDEWLVEAARVMLLKSEKVAE